MAREQKAELWPTRATRRGRSVVLWFFHRVAANGKVTDPSQAYTTRRAARRGIERRWPGIRILSFDRRPR